MESLCWATHLRQPPLTLSAPLLSSRPAAFSKASLSPPLKSSLLKPPPLSLRASYKSPHSPSPYPKSPTPLSSLIRPVSVAAATATAAAAIFLAGLRFPALSAPVSYPPPSSSTAAAEPETLPDESKNSETLTDAEKERQLEEYLVSHPDDIWSHRALMEVKIKSRKFPEAIDIVDRLIALEPEEKDLPLLKAHLQSYSGDTEAAKRGFEELLQKDPFLVEAYHGLVMAASHSDADGELESILKRIEGAMELCKKAKRKEDLRDFKLLVAQIRVVEGKYEDSLKIYQELVREEPRDFRPYLCQGIIYTLLRNKDAAEKQFEKYRRLVPKGHPYAQYFDENMIAMKVFGQMDENRRKAALKS